MDKYKELTQNMRYGYVYCRVIFDGEGFGVDFIHEEVNAAYERLTGITHAVGLRASELFPDIHITNPGFLEKHLRVAETGIADIFELYLEPLNKWFSVAVHSTQHDFFTALIDDITGRKEAEKELKQSEERFRSMFEDHSAIQVVLDSETGNILDANRSAEEFYGWPLEELKKKSLRDIDSDSTQAVPCEMDLLKPMEKRSFLFRHRRADGSSRDVEFFGKKIRMMGRDLVYSIIHDITDKRRLEELSAIRIMLLEKFQNSSVEELLQTTLDEIERVTESEIGFVFVVAEDQTRLLLKAASTNTSCRLCKIDGKEESYSFDEVGVWADAARERRPVIFNDFSLFSPWKEVVGGDVAIMRELVVPVIRVNTVRALFGLGNKASDYDEEDARWIGTIADLAWDVIESKISEERYRKMQEELHHSQKMELAGHLASGIAHEINNPLNFIQINFSTQRENFADLLSLLNDYRTVSQKKEYAGSPVVPELQKLRQKEDRLGIDSLVGEMHEIFDESQRGFDRIKKIVNGMRSLSYKSAVDKKVLSDINKGILETLDVAYHEYRYCAEIVTILDPLPLIACMQDQINQVLLNLIINSTHAIESQQRSSKGKITIRTWFDSTTIYCSVADDGPGIPAQIKKDIFNPFYTTKAPGKGTGLGLSISYDIIVNKHQGTMTLSTPFEGGSVFSISLPRNSDSDEKLSLSSRVEPLPSTHIIPAVDPLLENFVLIRGGECLMGSLEDEAGRDDYRLFGVKANEKQHQVIVSDFFMGKYAVTVADFRKFVEATGYRSDAEKGGFSVIFIDGNVEDRPGVNWRHGVTGTERPEEEGNHPVVHVSWNDAVAYCQWMSGKSGKWVRLPTEAEWEYACRAGTTTAFNTGENLTTAEANYNGNHPWDNNEKGIYRKNTISVDSFSPNGWGLYNMHGNVWEWCSDWLGGSYYDGCKEKGKVANPAGPVKGTFRVIRGGSWSFNAGRCRSAYRGHSVPGLRYCSVGFRLVFAL